MHDTKQSSIAAQFEEALAFLDAAKSAGGRCLVHCLVGASRSVSICLAFMIAKAMMTLRVAFAQCKVARPIAKPNRHFCTELIAYEQQLLRAGAGRVDEDGPDSDMTLADFGHA